MIFGIKAPEIESKNASCQPVLAPQATKAAENGFHYLFAPLVYL
jgi:hypothetical protein